MSTEQIKIETYDARFGQLDKLMMKALFNKNPENNVSADNVMDRVLEVFKGVVKVLIEKANNGDTESLSLVKHLTACLERGEDVVDQCLARISFLTAIIDNIKQKK